MHIGLIGGIGVAATLVYYQRLVTAAAARGVAKLDLTIVHGDIHTLIRNNLADQREEQAREFLPLVERLRNAGCGCVAITSIGGQFCANELAAISPLPVVSGVVPLDAYFAGQGIGAVGLLGTRLTMRSRLYGQLSRTNALALDDEIDLIGQTYQDVAVSGACTAEQRALFFDAGRRLIAAGADAIVLAGTDLGLAFDGHDPGFPVIDALDVHVAVLADLAAGRVGISEVSL